MKNFYIISVDKIYSSREPGLTCNVNEYIKRPNKSTFWCRIWVIDTLRQHECKDCQAAGRAQVSSSVCCQHAGRWRALAASLLLLMVKLGTTTQQHCCCCYQPSPSHYRTHSTAGEIFASDIASRPLISPCIVSLTATLSLSLSRLNLDTEARPRRCGVRRRGAGSSVMSAGQSLTRSDAPAADWDSKRYRQWHKKYLKYVSSYISYN